MKRIILDTDLAMGAPGSDIDDGFALALAHADPDIRLELITTVNGNTDVESATILTGELARRLDLGDIPIVKGAAAAFTHPEVRRVPADEVVALSAGARPASPGYAAVEIVRHVMANPGEITIVAIGPLTNVAAAILLEPRLAENVAEIVIMGGIFFGTMPDRSMPGEFNVWVDPEAAAAVLRSGAPLRWVGLDVTLKVRLTTADAERMQNADTPFAPFAGESTLAWIQHINRFESGGGDSCAMHDPLAVAVVTHPELVDFVDAHVSIVTGDGQARGVMITDLLRTDEAPAANCRVAASVDAPAFTEHFLTLVGGL
ncbi:MAG: nucleoside hydrolase [Janthinobacterium lividum]